MPQNSSSFSLFPPTMSVSYFQPIPAEEIEKTSDGLIHGVSAAELEALGWNCTEAKRTAYCMYLPFQSFIREFPLFRLRSKDKLDIIIIYGSLQLCFRPILPLPRRRRSPPPSPRSLRFPPKHHNRREHRKRLVPCGNMRRANRNGNSRVARL